MYTSAKKFSEMWKLFEKIIPQKSMCLRCCLNCVHIHYYNLTLKTYVIVLNILQQFVSVVSKVWTNI